MNTIKIFISFAAVLLILILTSFKPIEEKIEVDIEEILSLPTISDLIRDEIKRVEEEQIRLEEVKRQKREDDREAMVSRGITRSVPRSNTSMKTYMDYKKITNKKSRQYELQQNPDVYTDKEGFRKIDDKFMIAIGTYFQAEVGQEVEVELSNGSKFSAYVGDIKANSDTDGENLQHNTDKSIIEFLVSDKDLLPLIRKMGDCSYSEQNSFHGGVVSITVLENSIIE